MGLDMYLQRRTSVKNWDFTLPKDRHELTIKKGGVINQNIKVERVSRVVESVMYWRKANHIHAWFVANIQKNIDDCKDYYVDEEQLKELLEVCKKVQADHSLAQELLPTKSGFFFGSTEYDEEYFIEIKYTVEELEKILVENNKNSSFYYHSCW